MINGTENENKMNNIMALNRLSSLNLSDEMSLVVIYTKIKQSEYLMGLVVCHQIADEIHWTYLSYLKIVLDF